ncbi:MAG: DegT/DnrJ/EryC1/StrS family aminotransferase [Oleiphilaceae bacterium]|nr:DegT/DnrJ/EryC1/StrS family aminotransferase [Oleiphilaceae bacterium]
MIDRLNLKTQNKALNEDILNGIRQVLDSGRYLSGPQVAAFEREAASYLDSRHAISCASGSDALWLSLMALGIGPGDEVITTPFSFFATAEAIVHAGARPVFVDIRPDTFTLNPTLVEQAITPATRAILPVHLFGQPADMELLQAIAHHHDLSLVEDCAQSFGARSGARMTGTFGDTGCFSFHPNTNLGACGDGGLITTQSDTLADRLRALCNHGCPQDPGQSGNQSRQAPSRSNHHESAGHNSRLDEFQAVVLRAKLRRLERYNQARRYWASYYNAALTGLPGLIPPRQSRGSRHVFNQYTVRVRQRDRIQQTLQSQGIQSAIHYPRPLYRQPALARDFPGLTLPVAEKVTRQCLSLPIHPGLDENQADEVISTVRESLEETAFSAARLTG